MIAVVLAMAALLLSGGAGAETPDAPKPPRPVPFEEARGTLPWPVVGGLIASFGQSTADGRRPGGIVIETPPGALVVSPCNGLVVYAGEFKSYGALMIVSPGDGYHGLLSGLSTIDAQIGQHLSAGEPIGTMARPGADGPSPQLFLQLLKTPGGVRPGALAAQALISNVGPDN